MMKNSPPFHAALLTVIALAACLGCLATRKHIKSVSDPLDRRLGELTRKAAELDTSTRASPVTTAALDLTTAGGLLERARREMGGTARLQSIVGFTQSLQRITPKFGGGTVTGPKINEKICRSQWRQEDRENQRVVYFDGGSSGWIRWQRKIEIMSGSDVTSWFLRDFSNLSILMLSDKDPKRTVQLIQGTLNTVQIADDAGRVAQVTFDSDSGLPAQLAVKMVGKDWVSAPKWIRLNNWRHTPSGLRYPFTWVYPGERGRDQIDQLLSVDFTGPSDTISCAGLAKQ